jgi:hypothetical protein
MTLKRFIEEVNQKYGYGITQEDIPYFYGWALREVENDGNFLSWFNRQTPELCLAAVRQNGLALQYVKDQTPEICLEAVRRNGSALQYIEDQSPELCLEVFCLR